MSSVAVTTHFEILSINRLTPSLSTVIITSPVFSIMADKPEELTHEKLSQSSLKEFGRFGYTPIPSEQNVPLESPSESSTSRPRRMSLALSSCWVEFSQFGNSIHFSAIVDYGKMIETRLYLSMHRLLAKMWFSQLPQVLQELIRV